MDVAAVAWRRLLVLKLIGMRAVMAERGQLLNGGPLRSGDSRRRWRWKCGGGAGCGVRGWREVRSSWGRRLVVLMGNTGALRRRALPGPWRRRVASVSRLE